MKHQGTFIIAEPCHENWNQMTNAEQGRFCASCQKCVIDFTQKSPAEMKSIYDHANGNVCGRVKASQVAALRQPIRSKIRQVAMRGIKAIQMFALALVASFSIMFYSPAEAQNERIMGKIAYVPQSNWEGSFSGRVVDESGEPVGHTDVTIMRDGETVATLKTDSHGVYHTKKMLGGDYEIIVYGKHGEGSTSYTHRPSQQQAPDIVLYEYQIMGELIYEPEIIDSAAPNEGGTLEDTFERGMLPDPDQEALLDGLKDLETSDSAKTATDPQQGIASVDSTQVFLKIDPVGDCTTGPVPEEIIAIVPTTGTELVALTVYPNPTAGQVTLKLDRPIEDKTVSIRILGIDGKTVYRGKWDPADEELRTIDMQTWPSGIYMVHIEGKKLQLNQQLIRI